jgi:hypothetical protein
MIKHLKIAALSVALPLAAMSSAHGAISLNFVLPDNTGSEQILNYYNGGADQNGAIGPNYGITFGPDSLALLNNDQKNPPVSNVGNEPGGGNSAIFLSGPGDIMNVVAGFTSGFSFYQASYYAGVVTVYSGPNDTGTVLASLNFPATGLNGSEPLYGNWAPEGVTFAGTAESVDFSGTANYIAFTDVTIGSANPGSGNTNGVPDNTGLSIYALAGLALMGAARSFRKQGIANA